MTVKPKSTHTDIPLEHSFSYFPSLSYFLLQYLQTYLSISSFLLSLLIPSLFVALRVFSCSAETTFLFLLATWYGLLEKRLILRFYVAVVISVHAVL